MKRPKGAPRAPQRAPYGQQREDPKVPLPVMIGPDDIAVISRLVIAGEEVELARTIKVPASRVHECQLVLDRIERDEGAGHG